MEKLTISKLIKKYPYLQRLSEYTLFVSREEYDYLKNGTVIRVNDIDVEERFLINILDDDYYFEYAYRYFSDVNNKFNVSYIINGDIGKSLSYDKMTIIDGIDMLISSNRINLNDTMKNRYDRLKYFVSYDRFIDKYKDYKYNIVIDGKNYVFNVLDMIKFLNLDSDDFRDRCNKDNVYGISRDYYIYGVSKFFRDNCLFDIYDLNSNMSNNFSYMHSNNNIDFEAINKFVETTDTKYKEIKIDSGLENKIFEGLPYDYSELEIAIYIYIKMCKILTYDDEYYAVNQTGDATLKHTSIKHISSINLTNNKVVCFEFNIIYAKFLDMLGIHFCSNYKNSIGEDYGYGHANLDFRCGKFLVKADSVTSILHGDIMQAKLNQPLSGLVCLNSNKNTKEEFNNYFNKMYILVAKQFSDNNDVKVDYKETLDDLINQYSLCTDNIKEVSIDERLSILIDKANSSGLIGIDSLSYILQLRKTLFSEEQRKNNIRIVIIRNNEPYNKMDVAMASAIIVVNKLGFKEYSELNNYYFYNPLHDLVMLSQEELQDKFNNKIFEYVADDDPKIPGISEGSGIRR